MPQTISYDAGEFGVTILISRMRKNFLGVKTSEEAVATSDWVGREDAGLALAVGALQAYEDRHPGNVHVDESDLTASHAAVASLNEPCAKALGLPPPAPFVLQVSTTGNIAHDNFQIVARWFDGGAPVQTKRIGAFLQSVSGDFLIPQPTYAILSAIEQFSLLANSDATDRWDLIGTIKSCLEGSDDAEDDWREMPAHAPSVELEEFIQGINIYPATQLSLRLHRRLDGSIDFDPILFSIEAKQRRDAGAQLSESEGVLPDELLAQFLRNQSTGFREFENAKGAYLLRSGHYLVIDPNLLPALDLVREQQQKSPDERKAFAENPSKAIAEHLKSQRPEEEHADELAVAEADEFSEKVASDLFVETIEYSERVIGLGIWRPPVLPYVENPSNPWEPETFGIRIAGEYLPLKAEEIPELQNAIAEAIAKDEPCVTFKGVTIPATAETGAVVDQLIGMMKPVEDRADKPPKDDARFQYALQVRENFEETNYQPEYKPRTSEKYFEVPQSVARPLMDHQKVGFQWACQSYAQGYPGILNADDQGLGKTLQAIAFLAWLQNHLEAQPSADRKPILVVAPTSLLRNWIQEVEQHMTPEGLGIRIDAFGNGLARLRRPGAKGYDIVDANPEGRLDLDHLKADDSQGFVGWVLTTYTTLMNYQQSFAEIPFSAIIFDEIQNIKNPASMRHRAAQAMRADFRIGLTGTPIENSLTDLWAIMDALTPGRLGALKDFSQRYRDADLPILKELHGRVFLGDASSPALGQRRMKSEAITDLPQKNYRLYPDFMPEPQVMAYDVVFHQLRDAAKGRALKMLHYLRSVSLHPDRIELANDEGIDAYVSRSARLIKAIEILDDIQSAKERVLVFIESIEMQHAFRQLLKARYGLTDIKVINGATRPESRMKLVNAFQAAGQAGAGFEVMILGPRAAGVGLTLTAATHVIHLSRWWNPAVEEQCNDRIYRIGQKRDVTIHIPMAIHDKYKERSFDCILNNIMQTKRRLSRDTLIPPTDDDSDISQFMNGLYGEEEQIFAEIDNGGWLAFEQWAIKRMQDSGNWIAYTTPWSGDKGADGVFKHREREKAVIIQVKHTQNSAAEINASAVQQVMHALDKYDLPDPLLVVLTNANHFSKKAEQVAKQNGVILVDRARLCLWPNHIVA
jgi:hypothetical protein